MVIYQYECRECNSKHIGKTKRTLQARKNEHFNALTHSNTHSSIAEHVFNTNHAPDENGFKIIGFAGNDYALTIKESLMIMDKKPQMNENLDFKLFLY